MSATFTQDACRLAGMICRSLGWRPGDFWSATPAEIAVILAEPADAETSLSRAELDALMEQDGDGR